jgi:hypothetical protein
LFLESNGTLQFSQILNPADMMAVAVASAETSPTASSSKESEMNPLREIASVMMVKARGQIQKRLCLGESVFQCS